MLKKLLIILVMVSWCNVGFAEEVVISCKYNSYKSNTETITNPDWKDTYIIIPNKKIWKFRSGSEQKLIVTDNNFATYELHDDIASVRGGISYYRISFRQLNRYDGGYYSGMVSVPTDEFKKFKSKLKKYNYENFENVKEFSRKYMSPDGDFHRTSGVCSKSEKKF